MFGNGVCGMHRDDEAKAVRAADAVLRRAMLAAMGQNGDVDRLKYEEQLDMARALMRGNPDALIELEKNALFRIETEGHLHFSDSAGVTTATSGTVALNEPPIAAAFAEDGLDPRYIGLRDAIKGGVLLRVEAELPGLDLNLWHGAMARAPLFWAVEAETRSAPIVRLLLEHGADAALIDDAGRSTLQICAEAAAWGDTTEELREIIILLVHSGAAPRLKARDGFSPLAAFTAILTAAQSTSRKDEDSIHRRISWLSEICALLERGDRDEQDWRSRFQSV